MHGYAGLFRVPERLPTLELSDGREVYYREIRPEDQAALQRFHSRMSERSIRLRFFGPKPELSEKQARYFSHLNGRRAALVALDPEDPAEIIGVVRFDQEGEDGPAEYAAAIEDRYQGRGLGLQLTRKLMDLARERGVREIYAYVMPDNRPMTITLKRLGLPTHIRWEEGLQRVELSLQASE